MCFIWKRIWNWVQQLIQNITIRKKGMEPIDEIWIIYSCKKAEKKLNHPVQWNFRGEWNWKRL